MIYYNKELNRLYLYLFILLIILLTTKSITINKFIDNLTKAIYKQS